METAYWKVKTDEIQIAHDDGSEVEKEVRPEPQNETQEHILAAADIYKSGGLVAFPTETVYGLGGDAFNPKAAAGIYAAKGRPSDNPLIVHIARTESLNRVAEEIPEKAFKLAEAFWPGPLTMIFRKTAEVPYETTGGLDTVAVRMPSHPVAMAFIEAAGGFVAAPSANTSGRPSPTTAAHVKEDLDGKIAVILDGGEVTIGLESTIVDMTAEPPSILRPGYITKEMLERVIGTVQIDPGLAEGSKQRPKAPGMKYRHYAPKADMTIIEGRQPAVTAEILRCTEAAVSAGKSVGILASEETKEIYLTHVRPAAAGVAGNELQSAAGMAENELQSAAGMEGNKSEMYADGYYQVIILSPGSRKKEEEIARHLYGVLRDFDEAGVDEIYSESFAGMQLGQAIMNRMLKAAGHRLVEV